MLVSIWASEGTGEREEVEESSSSRKAGWLRVGVEVVTLRFGCSEGGGGVDGRAGAGVVKAWCGEPMGPNYRVSFSFHLHDPQKFNSLLLFSH